jgi:ABC-type uncharacterized transport system substrate-binding protein
MPCPETRGVAMRRREFITLLGGVAASPFLARATDAGKIPHIGVLLPGAPATFALRTKSLRQGLADLGYVEGKTITIEWRWAEERVERLPELATELVKLNVAVIVANGALATKALKNATGTIPILMAGIGDPVGIGLVDNLARPTGNITGFTVVGPDLSGKRLELLKEANPSVVRVNIILTRENPNNPLELHQTQVSAQKLGLQTNEIEISDQNKLEDAFAALTNDNGQALVFLTDAIFYSRRRQILDLVAKTRLPAMYFLREFADEGGLMSYGPNLNDIFYRCASYVDKILKGAKPAELPVQLPSKFELIINLKTAKTLDLTIPHSLLSRADELIDS